MPEATTANPGTINRQDWRDDITLLEPQQTPYTSRIDKRSEAAAMLVETFGDRLAPATTTGNRERGPSGAGSNQLKDIGRFNAFQHFKQRDWAVSHHQRIIATRGGLAGVSNAEDRSRARAELLLKIDMEAINCSNNETQDGAGGSADMLTRGCFKWLTPVGTTLGTGTTLVASTFQATLNSVLVHGNTGGMLFSEDQLYQLLKELATIRGTDESFFGLFGFNVVETMDKMSRIASTNVIANPGAAAFYDTRQDADEYTIQLMVNIYKCSFGTIEVVKTVRNQWTDATATGDPNAGLVLDPDLWYIDMLESINEAATFGPDTGNATVSGGTWQATWVNLCRSPRGNGKIVQS
jgi:hypothetical protein